MPSSTSPAVFSLLPRAEYDSLQGWNSSLLKVALTKTPAHAYNAFLAPDRGPSKDSPAFSIGTLVHEGLLEPEVWDRIISCSSGSSTKAFAQAVKDAAEQGAKVVQSTEYDLAGAMVTAVRKHPALGTLFEATDDNIKLNELTLVWPDPQSGQQCKARLDAVRITDDEILILDLKTTADATPLEFGRSAASYHYLLQAAFYADGLFYCARALEKLLGLTEGRLIGKPVTFEFVAIEKEAPHQVARYRLTDDQAVMGRRLYRRAMEMVTTASELKWWPGYDTAPVPLELPNWAWTHMENLTAEN